MRGEGYTLEQLVNAVMPVPDGLLGGRMLMPGSVCMMAAMEGSGKTFLAIDLAMKISTGKHWGPWPTKKGRILFLSEEMQAWEMKDRVTAMGSRVEMFDYWKNMHFRFKTGFDLAQRREIVELKAMVHELGVNLVIIDTMRDIHTAKENDNDTMNVWIKSLRDDVAVKENCTILMIHHFKKAQAGEEPSYRGAGIVGGTIADIIYLITNEEGESYIKMEKTRHSDKRKWGKCPYRIVDGENGSIFIDISSGVPDAA